MYMAKIVKSGTRAVVLKELRYRLERKRDMELDAIKVASRSDDQANSACNLLKQLYSEYIWLVQMTLGAYSDKYGNSSHAIEFDDEEKDRLSRIILNDIKYEREYLINSDEAMALALITNYTKSLIEGVATVLSACGASSYNPGLDLSYVITTINDLYKSSYCIQFEKFNPYEQEGAINGTNN